MRRLIVRAVLGAAASVAPCAFAQDYSWELSGGTQDSDFDSVFRLDVDSHALSAAYYFRAVSEDAGPYALAAFLDRSSRITVGYAEDKATTEVPIATLPGQPLPPDPFATIVDHGHSSTVSGRHVWRESGWYAGGALFNASSDQGSSLLATSLSLSNDEVRGYSATVGKYFGRATTLELSLDTTQAELEFDTLSCVSPLPFCSPFRVRRLFEADTDNVSLAAFHVGDVGRMRYALSGGAGSTKTETQTRVLSSDGPVLFPVRPLRPGTPVLVTPGEVVTTVLPLTPADRIEHYALGAEIFPTKALGVGLDYARSDGDEPGNERYEISATWFFRRNIAVQATFGTAKTDVQFGLDREIDTVGLRLIGRL